MTTPENTPAPADTGKPWFDGADAETIGYIQNRGLDKMTPDKAAFETIKAHREAAKHLGTPPELLVRIPKDAADQVTRDAMWNRLGRPAKPEEYDFTEGGDLSPDFKAWAEKTYHKLGFTKEQVAGFLRETVARIKTERAAADTTRQVALQAEETALNAEWGAKKAAFEAVAERAMEKLGYTKDDVAALISVKGRAAVYKQFANLASKIGEDQFVRGEGGGGLITKEQALEQIAALKRDTGFRKRYLDGDIEARKQMNDLHAVASGFVGA